MVEELMKLEMDELQEIIERKIEEAKENFSLPDLMENK
ncbi:hypothetical protein ERICI_01859 [Paenibacillus larvae subsp. larvae]|uniref:Uncharacterized protein n=1 Tax=Paenibacillus larvae subsp. larvae TaxID=147375 RepID=A0A2L1UG08_9BACL|nr:hypothetical protein ERICI_01859 [Paenibacillus larvae subsp. larvae]AVG12741.1 hypothetical protein ERICII_02374 [Paenibacillus larvae subsp. larvae DSM 25430]ETK27581.1 hypothetical protein ERIC1_1c10270 [Paenibacillus larvae subsp. larvae DSM 25719]AVF27200.1 hypothetical protein ERICIII_03073 [Paenibacillus larvae subsp. larvae]AVF31863.1 hypothetical protein ERICIV_02976 [Paenibacillus larvae subsp. larvae]